MVDFASPARATDSHDGRRPPVAPTHCNRRGCSKAAFIALALVNVDGRQRCGTLGQWMQGQNLRAGVYFVEWITRCGDCYELELRHAGKSRDAEMTAGTELDRQIVAALSAPEPQRQPIATTNETGLRRLADSAVRANIRLPYKDDDDDD